MELKILTLILILSGLETLFLAGWSAKYLLSRGSWAFMSMMICTTFYSIGYGMEISSISLNNILFWSNVQYLGISFIPALNIIMALKYTGRMPRHYWIFMPLLFLIPVITFTLHYTTLHHDLFYRNISVDLSGPFPMLSFGKGPFYMVHSIYSNVSFLTGILVFIDFARKAAPSYRKQGILMLLGYIIPWTGYILYMTGFAPGKLDIIPFTLTAAAPIWAVAMFRYQLFDLLPVARDYIFESMNDGIIIIDHEKRIADCNYSAKKIFPELNKRTIGQNFFQVLKGYEELNSLINSKTDHSSSKEIMIIGKSSSLYYRAVITPLYGRTDKEEGNIITLNNITAEIQMIDEMKKLASTDDLTGICNRRNFMLLAQNEIERSDRYGRPFTGIIFDIDYFKKINDSYGHMIGDMALKHIVEVISIEIRAIDIFCRYGGEEFALFLPETEPEAGLLIAQRLCRTLAGTTFKTENEEIRITASFGVSGKMPGEDKNLETVLKDADTALYEAKNSGRNIAVIKV